MSYLKKTLNKKFFEAMIWSCSNKTIKEKLTGSKYWRNLVQLIEQNQKMATTLPTFYELKSGISSFRVEEKSEIFSFRDAKTVEMSSSRDTMENKFESSDISKEVEKFKNITASQCFELGSCAFPTSMIKIESDSSLIIGTCEGYIKKFNLRGGLESSLDLGHHAIWSLVIDKSENLYAASSSGVINHIRISDFTKVKSLSGHQDEVKCLAISNNSNNLFSGSGDKTVIKWTLANNLVISEILYEHPGKVYALDISSDSKILASGCDANLIIVYLINEKRIINTLTDTKSMIWCIKFTPNLKYLISGCQNSEIFIWTCIDWNLYSIFSRHHGIVQCLEVSYDSNFFISAGLDQKIIIWDIYKKKDIAILEGHSNKIKSIILSSDEQQLFSTGYDKKIAIWDVSNYFSKKKQCIVI